MGANKRERLRVSNKLEVLKRILVKCKRDSNGCLIWTGDLSEKGYGRIRIGINKFSCHRLMLYIVKDFQLGSALNVLHKPFICKSRACCEPDHLYAGTQLENILDAVKVGTLRPVENLRIASDNRAKATHCQRGHEFTKKNIINNAGKRMCRECNRLRSLAHSKKVREAKKRSLSMH